MGERLILRCDLPGEILVDLSTPVLSIKENSAVFQWPLSFASLFRWILAKKFSVLIMQPEALNLCKHAECNSEDPSNLSTTVFQVGSYRILAVATSKGASFLKQ